MSRYIDADKLLIYLKDIYDTMTIHNIEHYFYTDGIKKCIDTIDTQPTADVKPVVYGKWIWDDFLLRCTICGVMQDYRYKFCPSCGADMRNKEE